MVGKIRNQHRLKAKEVKDLLTRLRAQYKTDLFPETAAVDTGMLEEYVVTLVNNEVDFFKWNDRDVMTLVGIEKYHPPGRCVTVDMGAIRFISNGADVMAPGVVAAEPSIQEGDEVWVCDQMHHKPLAVGIALTSGEAMTGSKTGKAIKTLHYVGDHLWILTHQ
jgi:PUA-domain protein